MMLRERGLVLFIHEDILIDNDALPLVLMANPCPEGPALQNTVLVLE